MAEADRVSYTFGMKLNMGNFQSVDYHISHSSDVMANETPAKALKRVVKFVEGESERKLAELEESLGVKVNQES